MPKETAQNGGEGVTKNLNNSAQAHPGASQISAVFDLVHFQILVNEKHYEYNSQILTQKGLHIYDEKKTNYTTPPLYVISGNNGIQFDKRFAQNNFCIQLASALDRGSNAAYRMVNTHKKNEIKSNQNPQYYSLQICQLIMKKIPIKARCFQTTFKNVPLHKVKILFENDLFFIEVVKYLFKLIFKADIDQIYQPNKKGQHTKIQQEQSIINFSQKQQQSQSSQEKSVTNSENHNNKLSDFHKRVIEVFAYICQHLKTKSKCYQRINIILNSMFTQQTKVSSFLYELNRNLICQELNNSLPQIFHTSKQQIQRQKANKKNTIGARATPQSQEKQVLQKVIHVIKTVQALLNKSQISYKIIIGYLLSEQNLSPWLKQNLSKFKQNRELSIIFFQLFNTIVEISPIFVEKFYESSNTEINKIIKIHISWIFEALNIIYKDKQIEQLQHKKALCSLDHIMNICKITIKQNISKVNFGRQICRQICQHSTNLRSSDIKDLTYICCISEMPRPTVIKYLFKFFSKFIKSMKQELDNSKVCIVAKTRKNKHNFLEIMQSIRKISEIQSIDFCIEAQLLQDIQSILKLSSPKHRKQKSGTTNWKGSCISSAYEAMMKNLKIQSIQKDNQTHDQSCNNTAK